MKPVFLGCLLLIQLATLALAADQVQELHDLDLGDSCKDVAFACQQFYTDGNGAELCCHALAAANERCFCSKESSGPVIKKIRSSLGELCEIDISLLGSTRCSEFTNSRLGAPVHVLSSLRGLRKLVVEQDSSQAQFNSSSKDFQNKHKDEGRQTTGAHYPGIMAAGFFGSLVMSCAFLCPCWQPKKKDENSNDSFKQDISINSISSDSRSTGGRSLNSSFSGFTVSGAHLPAHPTGGALAFTMAELMKVTGNFSPSHKIGQGGFGTVYKGKLRDGTVVAVKRAKKDAFEARLSVEFQNELDMLSQVDHLNLVKLIGYLEEEHERIIVVEYVPNGNLREHLDGLLGNALDMATRLDISIDIAHALTYLHLYADRPIIHRDVKASNILLTDTCRAKVADFGFSRMGPTEQGATHVSTQVKGTAGYLDPEYLTTYQLNQKSDVYSFGILLIEIFTGRRPIELKRPSDERVTVRWAFKKFIEGKVMEILDPRIERTPAIYAIMERLAELAFACSAPTKSDRPSMKKAQEALWHIRKDYQAHADPGRSPSHARQMSHATFTIPETDSHASPSVQSPRIASPTRPITPMSPGGPTRSITPMSPGGPTRSITPMSPGGPTRPITPMSPSGPTRPITPMSPSVLNGR